MPALPTGTVTFLFTDIQGSTPLWEHEPEQMRAALARHDALLRAAIEAHGGQVYKLIGDAFQAAFSDAGAALAAALAAQRALAAEAWPTSVPVCVRMGLHLGPAEAAGSDYATTHTLNRVARIMSVGHGGQIVVSLAVAEAVRGGLPPDVTLRDLGQHRLKGLTQLEHLFQATVPDLPSDFPPLASLDTRRHNLPTPLTSFVGRTRELGEVQGLLASSRLLTLSGPGGAGKTRLAVQVAWAVWETLPDGAWLVELAPLADGALVLPAVAAALGVREQPGRPLPDVLADHLHTRRVLLVLDNCEHLVTACAQAADQLLRAGPGVQVLATSREALGIAGETAYRVPSLSLPNGVAAPEALDQSEAVQLFMQRARAALPGFTLNEHNAAHIAQICRRLDGIPLALELAASRVKLLRVDQIAARLDDRFRLLTGGSRTALPRQQTLRALIDWSYDLLAPAEAALLRTLSVFAGGWTLEAVEAVGAAAVGDEMVLDTLAVLVDKSLVNTGRAQGEDARYTLLETIRQYANEKLLAAGEAAAARDRHLAYFRLWAEAAEPHLFSADESHWLALLEVEHDNLRAALGWGLETDPEAALRLAVALFWFWERRSYSNEAHRWLTETVARVQALPFSPAAANAQEHSKLLGTALVQLGGIATTRGEMTRARDLLESSVPLLRAGGAQGVEMVALAVLGLLTLDLGSPEAAQKHIDAALAARPATGSRAEVAMGLHWLGQYAVTAHGDFETGRAQLLESIQMYRDLGSQWGAALSLMALGFIAKLQGQPDEAASNLRQAMEAARALGDRFRANQSRSVLADVARSAGRLADAHSLYREAIVEWQALSFWVAVQEIMEYLAYVAAAQAKPQRAARLLGAAEALRVSLGVHPLPHEPAEHEQALAALRDALGTGAFEAEWAAGRALTREQAVAYAASDDDV